MKNIRNFISEALFNGIISTKGIILKIPDECFSKKHELFNNYGIKNEEILSNDCACNLGVTFNTNVDFEDKDETYNLLVDARKILKKYVENGKLK